MPTLSERRRKQHQQPALRHERLRQMRGLILLALAIILFAVLRAGLPQVCTPGWWRFW